MNIQSGNPINLLIYEKENEYISRNHSLIKNIICSRCEDNININMKIYRINLYNCKNNHTMNDILLNEFEEIQSDYFLSNIFLCSM